MTDIFSALPDKGTDPSARTLNEMTAFKKTVKR
jgi:hypothetical protein